MILVKANRLHFHARHTSQQLREHLLKISAYTRIQDPAAVFAYPNNMVFQIINAMGGLDILHGGVIHRSAAGFIHPRLKPWRSACGHIENITILITLAVCKKASVIGRSFLYSLIGMNVQTPCKPERLF